MANSVVMDEQGLAVLLDSEDGPVGRDLLRRVLRVEARAVELCSVDEDRLRGSIDHEIVHDGRGLVGIVGTNVDYAIDVERGTGLYETKIDGVASSPNKGHVIEAKTKKALAFTVGGRQVVVRSIKGMGAQPFLRPALDAVDED